MTMTIRILILCLFVLGIGSPFASALVTRHGREPIHAGWDKGLDALVNHPARVSGSIGPIGPIARFHYSGDVTVFNDMLERYAVLAQKVHTLYLHTEPGPVMEGFKDGETHDFDLSITVAGECYLHLYTMGRIKLEELRIPGRMKVEVMPPAGLPVDPEQRGKILAEQKRVEGFAAAHRAKAEK